MPQPPYGTRTKSGSQKHGKGHRMIPKKTQHCYIMLTVMCGAGGIMIWAFCPVGVWPTCIQSQGEFLSVPIIPQGNVKTSKTGTTGQWTQTPEQGCNTVASGKQGLPLGRACSGSGEGQVFTMLPRYPWARYRPLRCSARALPWAGIAFRDVCCLPPPVCTWARFQHPSHDPTSKWEKEPNRIT